ncbi:MAG: phosphotransferase, partial [Acidobacteriota bacterium]
SARALIVEDGGDRLLADVPERDGLAPRYAEAAQAILALQTHGLEVEGPNPDLHLDEERLRRELDFTEQHALRGWLESGPSRLRDKAFDRLAAAVAQQPRRLCHRDYHSRNLLVDDGLMVLDFQDAMEGPLFYDLVSLLRDDYRDIPTAAAARALQAFAEGARVGLEVAAAAEVPEEPGLLPPGGRQGLALTGAQRSLKALGTFGYQVSVNGRHEYAAYGRRTWRHARRALAALGWHDLIDDLAPFDRL